MNRDELLWRQYAQHVELLKHYLKLSVEFNVFYYAITGAIASYYFAHATEPLVRHALIFPAAMSTGFGIFFFWAAGQVAPLRAELISIRNELGLRAAPDLAVLAHVLRIFGGLMLLVAVGLSLLWCR